MPRRPPPHSDLAIKMASSAVARYEDERKELIDLGVDVAFNYYSEVGSGFAAESRYLLEADNSLDVAAQV